MFLPNLNGITLHAIFSPMYGQWDEGKFGPALKLWLAQLSLIRIPGLGAMCFCGQGCTAHPGSHPTYGTRICYNDGCFVSTE